ncbi:hypothetical protein [Aureimonas ureilytica]|uniref:hypothetical protein n=1 Tax=Aureimonas ureilytica TaxID=401562 RepID=UPI000A5255D1|nr:hypothetical protein [Aureimonas ureilytica]
MTDKSSSAPMPTGPKPRKRAKPVDAASKPERSARLQRQAEYQRAYRADQKRRKIPSRDDAARVALHWFITLMIENGNETGLGHIHREIVRRLVELGFDADGADRRVSDLIDRYEDGWTFQSKPHLRATDAADGNI